MATPSLCVTVTAATTDELRRKRDAARDGDLVELRLDGVERPDPVAALAGRTRPAIVTCRARFEGGRFDGSEEERRRILRAALDAGAEFVDVEAAASFAGELLRERRGRGIVLSMHDFDGVPADLAGRVERMRASGAEVVKVAVRARCLTDVLPLLTVAKQAGSTAGGGHVLIAMGEPGLVSRICAARFGSRWTYAGDEIAPGQIKAGRLLGEFGFRRIGGDAALFGVVGRPVAHSLSPVMHNAGFAALDLNAVYLPLAAGDARDFAAFGRAVSLRGASVTAPFKVDVMEHLDEVDPAAARVGAVNTIVTREGRWVGLNTDVEGFLAPLAGLPLRGCRATILGAGGAARAAAIGLASEGATVTVAARRRDAAAGVAALCGGRPGTWPPEPGSWDLLVNATTVGSGQQPVSPLGDVVPDGAVVYDMVYRPHETRLLEQARAAGCRVIHGIEMLVAQAERQFEVWTGLRPARGLFRAALADAAGVAGGRSM